MYEIKRNMRARLYKPPRYYTIGWYNDELVEHAAAGRVLKDVGGIVFTSFEEIRAYLQKNNLTKNDDLWVFDVLHCTEDHFYNDADGDKCLLAPVRIYPFKKFIEII